MAWEVWTEKDGQEMCIVSGINQFTEARRIAQNISDIYSDPNVKVEEFD